MIIKLQEGTQGLGVILAETTKSAKSIIDTFYKMDTSILLQKYIEESNGEDIRIFVVGNKIVVSRIAYHYITEIMHQIDFAIDWHTGGGQRHNFPQIWYAAADEKSRLLAEVFNASISFTSCLIKGSFRNAACPS